MFSCVIHLIATWQHVIEQVKFDEPKQKLIKNQIVFEKAT